MIDQETINKIFDTANIVDVVSEFVNLKKRGVNYIGCCPFHNEKTPSFTVSPAKNIYKCFGCGKGGNSVNFVMEHEQLSYYDALKYLAKKYNIEIKEKEFTPEEKERHDDRESMMVLNEYAKNTFIKLLKESEEGKAIGMQYFVERGFSPKTIDDFELGFTVSDRKYFTEQAIKNGYKQKYLVDTGLSILREDGSIFDRFSNRVMFPIHGLTGKVIGFGGRVLDARTKGVSVKYMNSPQSVIYDKSRSLYGIYQAKSAITRNDKCYLVEGYTDVLSMHQSGVENVVASNGTSLTIEQIRLIRKFTNNVTILYDGDAAGIHAALRGIDMILKEEMNVKILLLPDGEDPDSYARKHSSTELVDFIDKNETDFILFKTQLLLNEAGNDPTKLSSLINDIVSSVAIVPDSIKRSIYIKECSKLMNVGENILHIEINKLLRQKTEQLVSETQKSIPLPKNIVLNNSAATAERYKEYEEEILELLIKYGDKTLFVVIPEEDGPSTDVSLAKYIITELETNDIVFKNELCKRTYDIYNELYNKGEQPNATTFTLNPDTEISQFSVNLLVPRSELSKIWEKHNRYIAPEEKQLKTVIDRALIGYKAEIVLQTMNDIGTQISQLQQSPDNIATIDQLMEQYSMLLKYKNLLHSHLGRIISRN